MQNKIPVGLVFKICQHKFILANFIYLVNSCKLGLGHPWISLYLRERKRGRYSLRRWLTFFGLNHPVCIGAYFIPCLSRHCRITCPKIQKLNLVPSSKFLDPPNKTMPLLIWCRSAEKCLKPVNFVWFAQGLTSSWDRHLSLLTSILEVSAYHD